MYDYVAIKQDHISGHANNIARGKLSRPADNRGFIVREVRENCKYYNEQRVPRRLVSDRAIKRA